MVISNSPFCRSEFSLESQSNVGDMNEVFDGLLFIYEEEKQLFFMKTHLHIFIRC